MAAYYSNKVSNKVNSTATQRLFSQGYKVLPDHSKSRFFHDNSEEGLAIQKRIKQLGSIWSLDEKPIIVGLAWVMLKN